MQEEISQQNMEKKAGKSPAKSNRSLSPHPLTSAETGRNRANILQVAKALAEIGDALTTKSSQVSSRAAGSVSHREYVWEDLHSGSLGKNLHLSKLIPEG